MHPKNWGFWPQNPLYIGYFYGKLQCLLSRWIITWSKTVQNYNTHCYKYIADIQIYQKNEGFDANVGCKLVISAKTIFLAIENACSINFENVEPEISGKKPQQK